MQRKAEKKAKKNKFDGNKTKPMIPNKVQQVENVSKLEDIV